MNFKSKILILRNLTIIDANKVNIKVSFTKNTKFCDSKLERVLFLIKAYW